MSYDAYAHRLASGVVSAQDLLNTDSYLITNFPRQADMEAIDQWLAQQDRPALREYRQGLEVGTGGAYGLRSTTLEFTFLTQNMRQYLDNTILGGKPIAQVTAYVYDPLKGFIVVQGEMVSPYYANTNSFAPAGDTYVNNVYQLNRLTEKELTVLGVNSTNALGIGGDKILIVKG